MKIREVCLNELKETTYQKGMFKNYLVANPGDTKEIDGVKHMAVVSKSQGWKTYQPVASNGKVVFISDWLNGRDWIKAQVRDNDMGMAQKLGGDYTKLKGQWVHIEDYRDEEWAEKDRRSKADDEKFQKAVAALADKGVDYNAELERLRGNPDAAPEGVTDEYELLNYMLQQNGMPFYDDDETVVRSGNILWNPDDDGYNYKDTSIFIKDGGGANDPEDTQDTDPDETDDVDSVAQQGQSAVDRLAQQGQDAVDRLAGESADILKLAGLTK